MANLMVPTQLKLLRGNPGKTKIRPEPMPELPPEPPAPPDYLNGKAREEWLRIINELYRLRLVTTLDLNVLAAYCTAFARWHTAELTLAKIADKDPATNGLLIKSPAGGPIPNPLVRMAARAAQDMVSYAGQFGLSPLARARIAAGVYENKPTSKFDGLLAS